MCVCGMPVCNNVYCDVVEAEERADIESFYQQAPEADTIDGHGLVEILGQGSSLRERYDAFGV